MNEYVSKNNNKKSEINKQTLALRVKNLHNDKNSRKNKNLYKKRMFNTHNI